MPTLTDADIAKMDAQQSAPRVLTDADVARMAPQSQPAKPGFFDTLVGDAENFGRLLRDISPMSTPEARKKALWSLVEPNIQAGHEALDYAKAGQYEPALIRGLEAAIPGAGPVAGQMSRDIDAGNYGAAAARGVELAAPEVAGKFGPAAVDAAGTAANALRDRLPSRIPTIPQGAVDAAGVVLPQAAHGARLFNRAADALNGVLDRRSDPGAVVLRSMRQSIEEARAAAEAHSAEIAARDAAAPAAAPPAFEPRDVIDERPDARDVLAAEQPGTQRVEPTPRMWPAAAAPSTAFQRLADAMSTRPRRAANR